MQAILELHEAMCLFFFVDSVFIEWIPYENRKDSALSFCATFI